MMCSTPRLGTSPPRPPNGGTRRLEDWPSRCVACCSVGGAFDHQEVCPVAPDLLALRFGSERPRGGPRSVNLRRILAGVFHVLRSGGQWRLLPREYGPWSTVYGYFRSWRRNQFSYRLYSIFFKTYAEKVWGISTKELSADWAAQRLKGLDLGRAFRNARPGFKRKQRGGSANRGAIFKTLIDEFRYPHLPPCEGGRFSMRSIEGWTRRGGRRRRGR